MASLFDELVAVSGLAKSVAPFTLTRLLLRARVYDPHRMTATDLRRAIPHLETGLAEFLPAADLQAALEGFGAALQRREAAGRAESAP